MKVFLLAVILFLSGFTYSLCVKQRATMAFTKECMAVSGKQDDIIKHWLGMNEKKREKAKKLL